MKSKRYLASSVACAAALTMTLVGCTDPGPVDPGPTTPPGPTVPGQGYQKGPNPTAATAAARGSFATASARVTGQSGFGGGNIYYPTDTSQGTFGGIVLAPPFTVQSSANADTAAHLASHGFVVLAFDANTAADFPSQRATQGAAALRYLTEQSTVRTRVDTSRLAFGGFSMGGGATMELANRTPSLKAALPMVPWHSTKSFPNDRVPTMILAAQNDAVASTGSHAEPFYRSIPAGTPKVYVEARGAGHFMPTSLPPALKRYAVSFMKRYVDNDTRYTSYITAQDSSLSGFQISGVS